MKPDPRNDTDHVDEAEAGWECAQLLAMARATATRAGCLEDQLQAFDAATLHAEDGAVLSAAELDRIVSDVLALQDGVDVMGFVANRLQGREETLVVAVDDVRAKAARALAAGSADRKFVQFAVGILGTAEGFPALAEAITTDASFVTEWGDISVRDLLGGFHESDPMRVRRVCLTARVDPDAPLPSLDHDAMQRLAETLRATDA